MVSPLYSRKVQNEALLDGSLAHALSLSLSSSLPPTFLYLCSILFRVNVDLWQRASVDAVESRLLRVSDLNCQSKLPAVLHMRVTTPKSPLNWQAFDALLSC